MAGINTGKVVAGGLLAGVVFNIIDFLVNGVLMAGDYAANATRLGLDPASMESPAIIATWIAVDFIFGFVAVFMYAAMRPRFGAGPKTAIYAGLVIWILGSSLFFGLTHMGFFTMSMFLKILVLSLVNSCVGAVAGARVYQEA